jgi:hypothetical protein
MTDDQLAQMAQNLTPEQIEKVRAFEADVRRIAEKIVPAVNGEEAHRVVTALIAVLGQVSVSSKYTRDQLAAMLIDAYNRNHASAKAT